MLHIPYTYTLREYFFEFAKANNFIRENFAKVGDHESLLVKGYHSLPPGVRPEKGTRWYQRISVWF